MGNSLSMSGPAIGEGKINIPVEAVRQLTNGTVVYMAKDGPYVKMVAAGNKDARYYAGTIDQFNQAKWDQATRMSSGGYVMSPDNLKKRNGLPTNSYLTTLQGKCAGDVGTPSNSTTPQSVQTECAITGKCTGYSYNEKTNSYLIHTSDISTGDGQSDWKCIPKATVGACTTADMKTPPWSQTSGSYAECALKCSNDPVCQGFAYNTDRKVCQTYGSGENAGNAAAGARVTTSDTNPTWSCVIKKGGSTPAPVVPAAMAAPAAPAPAQGALNDAWTSQGCWQDGGPSGGQGEMRAIGPDVTTVNSLEECQTIAKSKGANVMGLQYGNQCFYGKDSDYKKYGKIPADRCKPNGTKEENAWINNVWTLGGAPTPAPAPVVDAVPVVSAPELKMVMPTPSPVPSGPELKDNWMCIDEFSAPVKRFGNDVGCLTLDGKTCLYEYCSKPESKFPDNAQSLICGNDHMSKFGVTGYESPNGWCSNVNRVLPGATPSPLTPAVAAPPTPLTSAVSSAPPNPFTSAVPQPSTAFTELGTGLCRTSGMEYPAYEQRNVSEQECANACFQDPDCMGYAMSTDGSCQLYNTKGANIPRTAQLGDTIEKTDGNPSWKCKVKTPKVSIRGPTSLAISNPPLPPMQANNQFEDIQKQTSMKPVASLFNTQSPSPLVLQSTQYQSPLVPQSTQASSPLVPQSTQYQTQASAPIQPQQTATQVLGKIASTVYAPQIQAYNVCSAYFKNYTQGGGTVKQKQKSKVNKEQLTIDHQRKILRDTLARRR